MVRPRRFRRISEETRSICTKHEKENLDALPDIEINIDEFEAIRLRDYHDIQQKKSAEIMGISQPTFHRILSSARKKIAMALMEGNMIVIVGGDQITGKKVYKCTVCGFEWSSPKKEYEKCLECESKDITVNFEEEMPVTRNDSNLTQRRSLGGPGLGAGPPRVCKCPECGYESPKVRAVPCKNTKCPKCETPLCGSD